jgi:hypothetical protein
MLEEKFYDRTTDAFRKNVHVAAKIPALPGWRVVRIEETDAELPESDPDRKYKKMVRATVVEVAEWGIPATSMIPEDPNENPYQTLVRDLFKMAGKTVSEAEAEPSALELKALRESLPSLLPIDPRGDGSTFIPMEQVGAVYAPSEKSDEEIRDHCLDLLRKASAAYLEKIHKQNVKDVMEK